MDYAELKRKNEYTEMAVNANNYTFSTDPISSEEDLNDYYRNVVSDFRPDPRSIEYDQKQTQTDSVSTLRLHYHGVRAGDDPDYHKELFLEDTEKDPRRSFTDPDFREAVKQTYGRQVFLKRNLYPDDPGTGQITQGTKSPAGIDIQKLEGRALSESRYKQRLVDSLDGTEPRREFRYDNYSYIDKALANQGDLPYVLNTRESGFIAGKARPRGDNDNAPAWTDGQIDFIVAKLGRNAGAHYSAADITRMKNAQTHKADNNYMEKSRNDGASDLSQKRRAAMQQMALDTLRQVADEVKREESKMAATGDKMNWGHIQENIRRILDKQAQQYQMNQTLDDSTQQARKSGRGDVKDAGIYNIQNSQMDASMLAAMYQDLFNRAFKPGTELKGATDISKSIKQEIDKINQNWRVEWAADVSKSRANTADDFRAAQNNAEQTAPWYDTHGRTLQVNNIGRRVSSRADANRILQDTQRANFVAINDSGYIANRGRTNADDINPGSVVYSANQGTAFHLDYAAAAGSMGGVAAPLTTKQRVRFDVAENDEDGIADMNDLS